MRPVIIIIIIMPECVARRPEAWSAEGCATHEGMICHNDNVDETPKKYCFSACTQAYAHAMFRKSRSHGADGGLLRTSETAE